MVKLLSLNEIVKIQKYISPVRLDKIRELDAVEGLILLGFLQGAHQAVAKSRIAIQNRKVVVRLSQNPESRFVDAHALGMLPDDADGWRVAWNDAVGRDQG